MSKDLTINYDKTLHTPNTIAGIDTLYYFYETNETYDDFFLDILNQLDEIKNRYEKRYISYENKDIMISINNQAFTFNGKSQGFYWFTHIDSYLTIGFKDYMTNTGLNDIQVQLNATGIYTLGLKALLQYTDDLIAKYITGHKPLTRVDLNIFVESDLSWCSKEMFVARKRSYTSIFKEIATKHKLETLYIGKKPFLLRIYDKMAELQKSKKKDMMLEYFFNNGIKSLNNVCNIEFEMHREYFKTFNIDTVDDLLGKAELLFQNCLQSIRLVELNSITDNTKDSKNKNRAVTHPLWIHLHNSYKLKDFLALDAPLERIKRKSCIYTVEEAIVEHIALARKAHIHNVFIDEQFYKEVMEYFKNTIVSMSISDGLIDFDAPAHLGMDVTKFHDLTLETYLHRLESDMIIPELDLAPIIKQHQIALTELKSRGKTLNEEYPV